MHTLTRLVLCGTLLLPVIGFSAYEAHQSAYAWYHAGEKTVNTTASQVPPQPRAKNVIIFVGDGMGLPTIAAARIMAGQDAGLSGEEAQLSFETFPHVALSKTYNTNQQVPDSAGTMTAIITGVKTGAGVLSVDEDLPFNTLLQPGPHRLTTLIEEAADWGLATGVVTTTRVTHATPGATYAHITNRSWESDATLPAEAKKAGIEDIAVQFTEFSHGNGINLMLGGGRAHFLPASMKGDRQDERNLITEWSKQYSDGRYVCDTQGLNAIDFTSTKHILGLFNASHMTYEAERDDSPQGEPSLSEMTAKAIKFLSQFPNGYVLVVEGGRIDHAHHDGNAYHALTETIELSNAVAVADRMTNPKDTLIIVTADHSHVMTMNGYPVRGNPILGKVMSWNILKREAELAKDHQGLTYTTLQYANGPGARPRSDLSTVDTTASDYRQEALISLKDETHGGEDVAVYARGPGSAYIRGVMEQNVIYHVMKKSLGHSQ